jgi:hypothetical protein
LVDFLDAEADLERLFLDFDELLFREFLFFDELWGYRLVLAIEVTPVDWN